LHGTFLGIFARHGQTRTYLDCGFCQIPFKDQASFSQQMNNILKAYIDNLKKEKKKTKADKKASAATPQK
jgi:uncharacterized C2H2 Zn-finger protein